MSIITVDGLTKAYGSHTVLNDISFSLLKLMQCVIHIGVVLELAVFGAYAETKFFIHEE